MLREGKIAYGALVAGDNAKGDVLAVARVAGILAAPPILLVGLGKSGSGPIWALQGYRGYGTGDGQWTVYGGPLLENPGQDFLVGISKIIRKCWQSRPTR